MILLRIIAWWPAPVASRAEIETEFICAEIANCHLIVAATTGVFEAALSYANATAEARQSESDRRAIDAVMSEHREAVSR
jgi:hypothetical protein